MHCPADTHVPQGQSQIEPCAIHLPDHKKPIDPRIQQKHLVEDCHSGRPRRLKPAQINR
jgi:hypothetical protein